LRTGGRRYNDITDNKAETEEREVLREGE
jgi:hypothetical protein